MKVVFSSKAKDQIRKLPPLIKQDVKNALEDLANSPHFGKQLQRELSGFRTLAVRRYRIIYDIDEQRRLVRIHHVAHRKSVYETFFPK